MTEEEIRAKAEIIKNTLDYSSDPFEAVDTIEAALTQVHNEAIEAAEQADPYPYEPLKEGVLSAKNKAIRRLRIEKG